MPREFDCDVIVVAAARPARPRRPRWRARAGRSCCSSAIAFRAFTSASRCWRRSTTCSRRSARPIVIRRGRVPAEVGRDVHARPTAASSATPTSASRRACRRRRPGRCRARRSTICCCGTPRRAAPTCASGIASSTSAFDADGVTIDGAGRRHGERADVHDPRARVVDRRVRPRRAALAQVRPAGRRAAPRQRRRLLALRRRPAPGRAAAPATSASSRARSRLVLADSDLRRADERRRRAAAAAFQALPTLEPDALLDRLIADTPAVAPPDATAQREWPVRVEKDFSFSSRAYAGDRWMLVGDAGSFLDPVFSTGVAIALESALEGAQAVAAGSPAADLSRPAFAGFARRQRQRYRSFRRFVLGFYTPRVPRSVLQRGSAAAHVPGARHRASPATGVRRWPRAHGWRCSSSACGCSSASGSRPHMSRSDRLRCPRRSRCTPRP